MPSYLNLTTMNWESCWRWAKVMELKNEKKYCKKTTYNTWKLAWYLKNDFILILNHLKHSSWSEVYIWGGEWGNSSEPLANFIDISWSLWKGHSKISCESSQETQPDQNDFTAMHCFSFLLNLSFIIDMCNSACIYCIFCFIICT